MTGTVLNALHISALQSSPQPYEVYTIIVPILETLLPPVLDGIPEYYS